MNESLEIAENKVFILYFIKKMNMPVGNLQLIKIMLENRFMNYFYLQQYLAELTKEELLSVKNQDGNRFYTINEKGLYILSMFESIIPAGLKKRLEHSVLSFRKTLRMETMITADYFQENEDGYTVVCRIQENDFPLVEVKAAVGSREDARNICRNWTGFPQEVYSEILETLLKYRNKENPKESLSDSNSLNNQ